MKSFFTLFIKTSLFLILLSSLSFAQYRDYAVKIGGQFNFLLPATEFDDTEIIKISPFGRGFLRFDIAKHFDLEIGAGYGTLKSYDDNRNYYQTDILTAGGRLLYKPVVSDKWNPYFYAGLEAFHYKMSDYPGTITTTDAEKWTLAIPLGMGAEFALSNVTSLDLSVGINQTLDDELNAFEWGGNSLKDAVLNFGIGFTFAISGDDDYDDDGLTNDTEEKLGTDPHAVDTDGDGLADGAEVQQYLSDPLKTDSDMDGLSDFEEVKKYNTSPGNADTDADGLTDGKEVNEYNTDPLKADTDGDGLNDGKEMEIKTDPLKKDTDSDALSDGDEVNKHKTNPLLADTDGGSVNDGVEVNRNSNPLDATDDVAKAEVTEVSDFDFEPVYFATNNSSIAKNSEATLKKVLKVMSRNPDMKIEIQGHTDNVGRRDYNVKLSKRRALAVERWLTDKGIHFSRMITMGFGPDKPVASNSTEAGKAQNRRIEIIIK